MKKFRSVMAAVMAALMVVGMSSTVLAAGSSVYTDEYTLEVSYLTEDGEKVGSYFVDSYYYLFDYLTEDLALEGMPDGYELISDFEYGVSWGYDALGANVYVQAVGSESGSTTDTTTTDTTTTETTTDTTTTTGTTQTVAEEPADQNAYIEDVISEIAVASVDGTGVAKIENLTTLSIDMMKALKEYNVALEMTFVYNDTEYTLTIPAGEAIVDEDIQWYGPMWLDAHYGQGTTTTTATSASTYTVVSGDTLSLIAAEHDMSLAELAAKNPQITNINLILPGQVINL